MRKYLLWMLAALLLVGILWGGFKFYKRDKSQSTENTMVEVRLGSIEKVVTAQGKLEPKEYVDVGAQVSGLVKKLHVELGDVVKQKDLIAEIDPDVYASQVKGSEARLKTLQAQKAEQLSLVKQANQKLTRNQNLIKEKAVSIEILEDAQTTLEVANAQLLSLKAQIEEAQSTLDGNRANLSYTKIYAPMDGTVVSQSVKEGQTINANQTAPVIVQIANLDIMTVKAQVAEADITKLKVGMPMYFMTLGSMDRRWQGTIRQILPSPETVNDVVLYNVLVDIENKDHQLMTGMTTQMFFIVAKKENVPIIPASALFKRIPELDTELGQAYQVKVKTKKDTEVRTVIISLSDRSTAAVEKGLKKGETVLLMNSLSSSTSNTQGRRAGMARL
ncbi:MAG: efflux RND transporter periplasmic adaptor subunit [Candidatus Berkiella sp.]